MLRVDKLSVDTRLHNITLSLSRGQVVHVLGANGAGKTTLLNCVAGMLPGYSGSVQLLDEELSRLSLTQLAAIRAYQPQQIQAAFPLTVKEVLSFFTGAAQLQPEVEAALEISHLWLRRFNQLSGGEQRRVQLALVMMQIWPALAAGEGVLILDEPLQGLDIRHQQALLGLLSALARRGNLVLMSCHDINLSVRCSDDLILLKNGMLQAAGKTEQIATDDQFSALFDCQIRAIKTADYKIFETVG